MWQCEEKLKCSITLINTRELSVRVKFTDMHVETDECVCCPQLSVGVFPLICAASEVLPKPENGKS